MCSVKIQAAHRRNWLILTAQIVLNASQDKRTSELLLALLQVRPRQPMGADDALIKGLPRPVVVHDATECKAHGRDTAFGAAPKIYIYQRLGLETPCSFFAGFANDRCEQR